MGVFAPLVGIIGSMQAAEALKLIMGVGEPLQGRLLLLDALTMQTRTVKLSQGPGVQGLRGLTSFYPPLRILTAAVRPRALVITRHHCLARLARLDVVRHNCSGRKARIRNMEARWEP